MPSHLIIPFASASAPECQARLHDLALPQLQSLLALLTEQAPDLSQELSLTPPHERALARNLGLPVRDGQIPWAAAQSGAQTTPQAWFSLCHYQIGMDQVSLLPGAQLGLEAAPSRALFDAFAPLCAEDGITLHWESPSEWLACGEPLRGLACASLDRVSGRAVDVWLRESADNPAGARLLQRLQSEAQMLFYTHPAHDERTARGLLPVNGFWVHGAGALDAPLALDAPPDMPDTLRQAALRGDWSGWSAAWQALDAGEIAARLAAAQRGEPFTLTLCGERHTRTWTTAPVNAFARLGRSIQNLFGSAPVSDTLKDL